MATGSERVLVTGASGFVGTAVVRALHARGLRVRWSTRRHPAVLGLPGEGVRVGPVGPETDWTEALDGVTAVVHLAARVHVLRDLAPDPVAEFRAVNTDGTVRLAEVAKMAGVRRFVFVSTIGVNGEASGETPFTESSPPRPVSAYAISKWEAERRLMAGGDVPPEHVVVRPPLVYGPGAPGNFRRLLRLVDSGIPLPFRGVRNRRSMVSVANLADLLVECVTNPAAAGKLFVVSDGEDLSAPELVARLRRFLGRAPRLWTCPARVLQAASQLHPSGIGLAKLTGSLQVDGSRCRRVLDWSPPHTVDAELHRAARWYRATQLRAD
jgi:nucleoside-diphosphate-sugar epimerase